MITEMQSNYPIMYFHEAKILRLPLEWHMFLNNTLTTDLLHGTLRDFNEHFQSQWLLTFQLSNGAQVY